MKQMCYDLSKNNDESELFFYFNCCNSREREEYCILRLGSTKLHGLNENINKIGNL